MKKYFVLILAPIFLMIIFPGNAQEQVSDDEVNRVSDHLYCPTCANQALSACATRTCQQWRDEVRRQIASGKSDEEIIASFVSLYGAEVLGEPGDSTGIALTYFPVIMVLLIASFVLLKIRVVRSSE